jgi:hypothetical protein
MIFSNPNGGKYNIKISGNPGEFVHRESVPQDDQFGSVPETAKGYTFLKRSQEE